MKYQSIEDLISQARPTSNGRPTVHEQFMLDAIRLLATELLDARKRIKTLEDKIKDVDVDAYSQFFKQQNEGTGRVPPAV